MSPSWYSSVERGREPGVIPPTSAWCPRFATKPASVAAVAGEDGGDKGDVGQMGAAEVGVVEDDDIAGVEGEAAEGGLYGGGHGAKVHGDVSGLGHHLTLGVEQGAGEVEPLLHVGREAGAGQGHAHLIGYGDEKVAEDL